jgi:general transcription factor 3C polypeptide 1
LKLHDILEVILGFTNPDFMENDRWISDYNKSFIDDDILDADVGADKSIEEKKDEGDLVITRLSKQLKGNEYEKKLSLNDMFVVNFSKFFVKILDAEQGSVTFDNQQVLEKLIPFDEKFRDEVLNKVRDDAIWTAKNQSLQNLENKLVELKLNEYQKIKVFEILMFLEESQELGVAAARLLEYFQDKSLLENCLKILIENGYVLRSGFDAVVYIHWRFASNWLVKTYSSTNAVKVEEDATNKRKADDVVEEIEPKRIKIEESASVKIEPESSRSAEKKQKEQEEIDERQRNYIEIRPCPWIRINGTLNRRVMDRWLSTILAYIMTNPGVLLVDIFKRFNVLAPFDIRYLLEILQAIGAIKLMAYHESEVSLFSTNEIVEIGEFKFSILIFISKSPHFISR